IVSPITKLILLVTALAALAYIYHLKKKLWYLHQQMKLRDRERRTVVSFLNEIGSRFTNRIDLDKSLELVVDFCIKATRADAGAIFLRDTNDRQLLQARVVQGLFPPLHEVTTEKLVS